MAFDVDYAKKEIVSFIRNKGGKAQPKDIIKHLMEVRAQINKWDKDDSVFSTALSQLFSEQRVYVNISNELVLLS